MRGNTQSEQEGEDSEVEFIEVDPSGRYGRYKQVLGKGAFKKVYRAFDEFEGIEVAWNQVKVSELLRNSEDLERLYSEVHLLKTLKHKNIIKFYNSWVDTKNENINFITEIFTSGTLRQYRRKHKHVDLRALKKWSKQILEGLLYLHSHDPPIIHRDLKCDNIFVNGNQGEVKIGDLGLAAILHHANAAHSVIGTPEFMAPELYEEEYNELVDIYAFGMCLLELVTFEYPYTECSNAAQIFKKVTSGFKPASLGKVADPDVKAFIEKCIANVSDRLSAKELLRDPFLSDLSPEAPGPSHVNPVHSDPCSENVHMMSDIGGRCELANSIIGAARDLTVQGERKDVNTIFIKLRIADSSGPEKSRNIHFPFDIEADTSIAVASEMVHELDLTDQDIPTIADMIDSEIRALIPDWSPRDSCFGGDSPFDSHASDFKGDSSPQVVENKDDVSPLTSASPFSNSSFFPDQLPSGRKFWSDSPRGGPGAGLSPVKSHPMSPSEATDDCAFAVSPRDIIVTNWQVQKSDKVSHGHEGAIQENLIEKVEKSKNQCDSGCHLIKPSNLHIGRSDDHMLQEKPRNINLHEDKIIEDKVIAQDKGSSEKRSKDNKLSCQDEICPSKRGITLPRALNGECEGSTTEEVEKIGVQSYTEEGLMIIADELYDLLGEQQKELDELKLKHNMGLSRILKDLPPEKFQKVLKMCRRKVPDYYFQGKMAYQVPNIALNNGMSKRIFTRSLSTMDLLSPRFNNFKQESTNEMGIAVILHEDSEVHS